MNAMGLRAEAARTPALVTPKIVRPATQLRVIASIGGATMPELRHSPSSDGPTKGSRERGETPVSPTLFIATRLEALSTSTGA